MSMIKLSSGVEISEETVVAALKKAGIETKPKPKHIFEAGDVVKNNCGRLRIIGDNLGALISFDLNGNRQNSGQKGFESYGYQYIGKLKDLSLLF